MKNYRAILSLVHDMGKLIDKAYIGVFDEETGAVADKAKLAAVETLEKAKWQLFSKAGVNVDRYVGKGGWWKCAVQKYFREKAIRQTRPNYGIATHNSCDDDSELKFWLAD